LQQQSLALLHPLLYSLQDAFLHALRLIAHKKKRLKTSASGSL
jgi:hypothetical protein